VCSTYRNIHPQVIKPSFRALRINLFLAKVRAKQSVNDKKTIAFFNIEMLIKQFFRLKKLPLKFTCQFVGLSVFQLSFSGHSG